MIIRYSPFIWLILLKWSKFLRLTNSLIFYFNKMHTILNILIITNSMQIWIQMRFFKFKFTIKIRSIKCRKFWSEFSYLRSFQIRINFLNLLHIYLILLKYLLLICINRYEKIFFVSIRFFLLLRSTSQTIKGPLRRQNLKIFKIF